MEYINERPIVHDETGEVLKTEINPQIFRARKHKQIDRPRRELKILHRAMSKGKPKVKLSDAERILRNRASRNQSGIDWGGTTKSPDKKMLIVKEGEAPRQPRPNFDDIVRNFRKKQRRRLQSPVSAPPIFPDPMDKEMSEDADQAMFPRQEAVLKLTKGMSHKQIAVFNRAMATKSSSRGTWRHPEKAKKIAQRVAEQLMKEDRRGGDDRRFGDSESDRRQAARVTGTGSRPSLIKAPRYGQRQAGKEVRTVQKAGSMTGAEAYRPKSTHATLVKNQPGRMLEKLRGLIASWRKKTGGARQVVKNIPVRQRFGTKRLKKINTPKKETDLKHNK